MKQQYQTRYELLHENYQKWLTGFTGTPYHGACVIRISTISII